MDVKLTDTTAAFELPEWKDIVAQDPNRHIFSTPEWHRLWWAEFGQDKKLFVLTFLDPHPVGIAALMLDKSEVGGRVRFVGGDDLTDYLGPVSAGVQHLPAIAEALIAYLRDEIRDWSLFDAKCLPVPFGFAEWLAEAADRLGLKFDIEQDDVTAVLLLPDSFDEYLDQLPRKERHELRRKLRRFEEAAPESKITPATDATLMIDIATFLGMHQGSEGMKGKFMGPHRATFFSRLAEAFHPIGMLSLDFLESADERIASTFSLVYGDTFYLYNSAYEQSLRRMSPGLVLASRLIERCIGRGFRRFDFLRGAERYKFDLGAQALPLHSVRLYRSRR